MEKNSKIYIAGHNGMVGSSILRLLQKKGYTNLIYSTSSDLDLRDRFKVMEFFELHKPEYVFLAAAKVGGIVANNNYRAEYIYDNLCIQTNVINTSYNFNVKKLLFFASSCVYPKLAPQPLKEEYLLSGFLEETNKSFAIAKLAGIEMCKAYRAQFGCNFISVMPTNLYGTNDNYHPENSHVFPALIRRFIQARNSEEPKVVIWGSGNPKREFMHVDDLADASIFLMNNYNDESIINIGWGEDVSINELAVLIKKMTRYEGEIEFDITKPDGTPRKLMNTEKINKLGWHPSIKLEEGIHKTILEAEKIFK
jgi:GDP-L-fucose synthase